MDIDDADAGPAVTIAAAATQIGCLRPFIYSLINRKKLTGPVYLERPPRNAPRIYQTSIDEYLEWRVARLAARDQAKTARPVATDVAILDRLDELILMVRRDLRNQRSRNNAIASQLDSLMTITANSARDHAQSAQAHAKAVSDVQKLFRKLTELSDDDNSTVDRVLTGYREIVSALLQRSGNS